MLKEQTTLLALVVYVVDLGMTLAAFVAAWVVRGELLPRLLPAAFPGGLFPLADYLILLPWVILVWSLAFLLTRSYRSQRTVPLSKQVLAAARIAFGGVLVLTAVVFALRYDFVSRPWLGFFAISNFVFLAAGRLGLRGIAQGVRRRGYNYRTVLVVGTGERAASIAGSINAHADWGLRLLGFVGARSSDSLEPWLGDLGDLPRLLTDGGITVDEVLFVVSRHRLPEIDDALVLCEELGIRTRIALDFLPLAYARLELEEFDGVPLLTLTRAPNDPLAMIGKRAVDFTLSALLLFAALPLFGLIALAIRLGSRGPVLFRQTRCGLNGRPFELYKFRTMVDGAHELLAEVGHLNEMSGPVFKASRDPRVTWVGRVLRRWSLDELPQLVNVLAGDMSLVGPRPPIPEEVARYERWQRRRLSMKPGLTCLWQVSGRNQLDFDRWMELDLQYIDTWTPLLDLKILAKTVPAVLTGRGAH